MNLDTPYSDVTHMLERHRSSEGVQASRDQHGLPESPLHDDGSQQHSQPQLESDEAALRTRLSIAHVFPRFLRSFDGRIPSREEPSPTTLTELWSEADTAVKHLDPLSEITQEVAGWRSTYEGMAAIDGIRLHNL